MTRNCHGCQRLANHQADDLDGVYALRSVADPENRLLEIDENNNQAVTYFELRDGGTEVAELDSSPTKA